MLVTSWLFAPGGAFFWCGCFVLCNPGVGLLSAAGSVSCCKSVGGGRGVAPRRLVATHYIYDIALSADLHPRLLALSLEVIDGDDMSEKNPSALLCCVTALMKAIVAAAKRGRGWMEAERGNKRD